MAADRRHGVVDGECRSFAVPNLYITDTIMAIAARAADRLIAGAGGGPG